ncbi:MAG: CoA transferase [Chloroflexi bacterium]|nr:CoA transferase [Chloroflexota bacterium]
MRLPLEGLRVVALVEVWAGPWGASMLADMGAEVIHVEAIQRAAYTRSPLKPVASPIAAYANNDTASPRPWERGVGLNQPNRNKLGITLDLTRPRGIELLKQLIATSDIFIENYASGVVERMGLSYDTLKAVKPDLIYLSTSGYGYGGPYHGWTSFGNTVDAVAGHASLRYYPDTDPTYAGNIVETDAIGGALIVFQVLTALEYRARTGEGQRIETSQAETMTSQLSQAVMDYSMNGRTAQPIGNRDTAMAPHNVYRCKGTDRWVTIACRNDAEFATLAALMGTPELATDPRFADVLSRHKNQDALDPLVAAWTAKRDPQTIMHLLQAHGVPAATVMDDEMAYQDPHLHQRGYFQMVTNPSTGTHLYPGMMWKLSKTEAGIRIPSHTLGQHNREVFQGMLGLSDAEYAELHDQLYVGTDYLPDAELSPRDREMLARMATE